MNYAIKISTATDTADSLEMADAFLQLAKSDARYLKWFVLAMHASIQNVFTMLLDNGDGFLVQKDRTMKKMLSAIDSAGPAVPQSMDNFMELYAKIMRKENLRTDTIPPSDDAYREALINLNECRNDFVHFNAKTWYIESQLLIRRSALSFEIVTFFFAQPQAILWHDDCDRDRVIAAAKVLAASLKESCF